MCKVLNQAGKKAAAGADICDLDVKQTDTDRWGCLFPAQGRATRWPGDEIQNKIYTVVFTTNGYGFLHLLRLLHKSNTELSFHACFLVWI